MNIDHDNILNLENSCVFNCTYIGDTRGHDASAANLLSSYRSKVESNHESLREVIKKLRKSGQADRLGGSPPSSLTASICESFGPFFPF